MQKETIEKLKQAKEEFRRTSKIKAKTYRKKGV